MPDNSVLNKSLLEICQAMGSSMALDDVLHTIMSLTLETLNADSGSILLYEPGSDDLKMLAAKGLPAEVIERGYTPRKGSITEKVIDAGEPVVINEVVSPERIEEAKKKNRKPIKSAVCSPLIVRGEVIGTCNLNRYNPDAPFFDDSDIEVVAILGSQAAISIERARLYEENMRTARMAAIGQTVAGISHCIKNMLTGLRGGMGLIDLAQKARDWDTAGKGADLLRNNVERVSLLVLDMLDYSKEEKKPVRRRTVIQRIFSEVHDVAQHKAKRKNTEVAIEIAEDAAEVHLDPDQMFRCLLNLVENAVDSIDADGRVVMCSGHASEEIRERIREDYDEEPGDLIDLTVEDNGSGIPAENLKTIFEPFFSTKDSKGTGLGLAVTRKIVEEHGGHVYVDSEPGRGTTFHLVLPQDASTE